MDVKKVKTKNENLTQQNLFGEFVEEAERPELEFVKVYEEVANDGDQFTFALNSAVYNEDKDCLTVIDSDKNQALTVYFTQHPDAKFQSTPEGVRLGRAIQRAIKMTVTDADELVAQIKSRDMVLTITHTGSKGRLWTVGLTA